MFFKQKQLFFAQILMKLQVQPKLSCLSHQPTTKHEKNAESVNCSEIYAAVSPAAGRGSH